MLFDVTEKEAKEIIDAVYAAAANYESFSYRAVEEGNSQSVADDAARTGADHYLLANKLKAQQTRFRPHQPGSSKSVDPFDTPELEKTKPPQGASKYDVRWPNDPVEW